MGLKVFHLAGFGGRKARDLVEFHLNHRKRYPGLPNPQVQEVIGGGRLLEQNRARQRIGCSERPHAPQTTVED